MLGVIDVPRLGERYVGYGSRAILIDAEGRHQLATSACSSLADARLTATTPAMFKGADQSAFKRVRERVRVHRFGYDGYGYARLAAGSIVVLGIGQNRRKVRHGVFTAMPDIIRRRAPRLNCLLRFFSNW